MKVTYAAYLAGIIDGEGTITITRHRQYQRPHWVCKTFLTVSNTNSKLMRELVNRHGGAVGTIIHRDNSNRRNEMYWRLMAHEKIRVVLQACLPYLVIKKQQAGIMLAFIRSRQARPMSRYSTRELRWQRQIRRLNVRGR
jgi:hypothetical protein